MTALESEGSAPIFFSTFFTACTTVEWFLPPNLLPISGNEEDVYFLERNIAICLGPETFFLLLVGFQVLYGQLKERAHFFLDKFYGYYLRRFFSHQVA